MRLRPDLFNYEGRLCAYELGQAKKLCKLNPKHVTKQYATLQGIEDPVEVLARSTTRLAERIEEITGLKVIAIGVPAPEIKTNVAKPVDEAKARYKARMEKLRKLAAQEPPTHECHMRSEILKARVELERLEPKSIVAEEQPA